MNDRRTILPTGTVTFLFTDIEGSTALLLELRERYVEVLLTHERIMRRVIGKHRGVVVNTEGDAFFAAFTSARDAIEAAAEAQRALEGEPWSHGRPLQVRMGLHTGEGRLAGRDYVGIDINRAARIAAAAHGGQTLLSDATRRLVKDQPPIGVTFRDLGEHRLKDIPTPERVWQLDAEGSTREFPALRSLRVRTGNLPLSSASVVGRNDEVAEVSELLATRRLVTLSGGGGAGKTTLALAVARAIESRFPDGSWFVPLDDAHDGEDMAAGIAAVLDTRGQPDRDTLQSIERHVAQRRMLLVLDNLEQIPDAGLVVAELLARTDGVRVLATSRARLGIRGEQERVVAPLPVPDPEARLSLDAISRVPSVALFVERAREVDAAFELSTANVAAVAQICAKLDGLPLALELAAARMRMLSPQTMLERLQRALPLLQSGSSLAPERQRTLRATIEWSYRLLDPDDQRLLARLGVFAGGWALEDAEGICDSVAGEDLDVFEGLASLVEKSLVRRLADDGAGPRFSMLNVVREYASEVLESSDEAEPVRERHALRFRRLAELAEPELIRTDLRVWQRRLRADEGNLRLTMKRLDETGKHGDLGHMAASLWRFWQYWGEMREGREWLESAIGSLRERGPSAALAAASSGLAWLLWTQGDAVGAEELNEEVIEMRRAEHDDLALAVALADGVWTAVACGRRELAIERGQEAMDRYLAASGAAAERAAQAWAPALAFISASEDDPDAIMHAAREAREVNQRLGQILFAAEWDFFVARAERHAGDSDAARRSLHEALDAFVAMGNIGRLPALLAEAAAQALDAHLDARSAQLAAASARYADEIGGAPAAAVAPAGELLEEARRRIDRELFDDAVAAGRAMTLDEAVALALAIED